MRLIIVLLFVISNQVGVLAQKKNCCHPPAFDVNNLPKAIPLFNRGNSHFPVNSKVDSVQFYTDQGFNLMHAFNFIEAYVSFNKVTQLDSNAAIGSLGKIMVIERAGLGEGSDDVYYDLLSDLEFKYITDGEFSDLEEAFYEVLVEPELVKAKKSEELYKKACNNLILNFHNNMEANLLYISCLENEHKIDSFSSVLLNKFPNSSALQHYSIHFWEELEPQRTLQFKYIDTLAKESGHLVHMPGHIYFYNGFYDQAESAFRRSYMVDSINNNRYPKRAKYNWNIIHNLQFLKVCLIEQGKLKQADSVTKIYNKAYAKLDLDILNQERQVILGDNKYQYWRRGNFEKAAEICNMVVELAEDDMFLDKYQHELMYNYFSALHALSLDRQDSLNMFAIRLDKHAKKFSKLAKKAGVEKAVYKNPELKEKTRLFNDQIQLIKDNYETLSPTFMQLALALSDRISESFSHDPDYFSLSSFETLAKVFEMHRSYDDALELMALALDMKPNSGIILLNMARLYKKTGQKQKAQDYLNQFNKAWKDADKGLIEFEKARVLQLDLNK